MMKKKQLFSLFLTFAIVVFIFIGQGVFAGEVGLDSWFNVIDYGAVPNDGNDDSPAIQRALDEAGRTGGGVVYMPRGTYLLGETLDILHNGVVLRGDGLATELRNNGGSGPMIRMDAKLRDRPHSFENVILESFKINGVDRSRDGIMTYRLTRGSVVRDLWVENCLHGMRFIGSWSFSVERNNIVRCAESGINLGNIPRDPETETFNGYPERVVNAVNMVGNTIRHCPVGLDYHVGHGSHIAGNTFELNQQNVFFRNVSSTSFMGNYVEDSRGSSSLMKIGYPGANGLVIGGNTFFHRHKGVNCIEIEALFNSHILSNRFMFHEDNHPVVLGPDADLNHIVGNQISPSRSRQRYVPDSPNAQGVPGSKIVDGEYIYRCVAPNEWRRTRMTGW